MAPKPNNDETAGGYRTPKGRKIHEEESKEKENTVVVMPDNILRDILSRLPAKPLLRFRCASKHWNSLITDPYFINTVRSRRMILMLSGLTHLYGFDPKHQSIVKLTYPFENQISRCNIIGTLNGIVLLVLETHFVPRMFILYNPFTRATKKLPDLPRPCCFAASIDCAYGFGHGNIIIGKPWCFCPSSNEYNNCYVFSLKNGSWTTPETTFRGGCVFVDKVGMFLNGFLHWVELSTDEDGSDTVDIVVLDVTAMVVTRMDAPPLTIDCYNRYSFVLGKLHGCLCMSNMGPYGFDVWVKEESEWSRQYSFALPFYRHGCDDNRLDVCILEEGRILVKDGVSNQIIMCHAFERCYDTFKRAGETRVTNRSEYVIGEFEDVVGKPFEYVESMVSPSNICHV